MKRVLLAAIMAAFLVTGTAVGQTASDLLQKAIYAEETAGDLDTAIRLYRQVVATSTDTRALAAQAQYRVGMCLLRKGDQTGARQAFETLIKDYPEQKELIAKARQSMPSETKLLPAPWREGEVLEMRMRLQAGAVLGTQVYTVDRSSSGGLLVQTRSYLSVAQWATRVEVDRETMRPKSSVYAHPQLGDFQVTYEPGRAIITPTGKPGKTVEFEDVTYDNEEALQVLRRLPLIVGSKVPLHVLSPAGGVAVGLTVDVQALEDVTVPAGKFKAFRVELAPVNQRFWISQDAARVPVKFEAGPVISELVAMRRSDSTEPVKYADSKFGVSFTAPPNWSVQPVEIPGKPEQTLALLDPELEGTVALWMGDYSITPAEIESRLQADMDEKVASRAKGLVEYRVRPGTQQTRKVGGQSAISQIADYKDNGKPMVEHVTLVRSEQVSMQIAVRSAASDFDAFRRRVEPILESFRIR